MKDKPSRMTMYRHAQSTPLSQYAVFAVKSKGKEFSYNGKVITKSDAFLLMKDGVKVEYRDKPGWNDGVLEDKDRYAQYLVDVEFRR